MEIEREDTDGTGADLEDFYEIIEAEADLPAAVLAAEVILDIAIDRNGYMGYGSIPIPVDGGNTTLQELADNIAAAFATEGFEDIEIVLDKDHIVFASVHEFTIEGTSVNAELLGLTTVSEGADVESELAPSLLDINAGSGRSAR